MTPAALRKAGEAIFGRAWQSELARQRGVTYHAVRNWLIQRNNMPADLKSWLLDRLRDRRAQIDDAVESLSQEAAE